MLLWMAQICESHGGAYIEYLLAETTSHQMKIFPIFTFQQGQKSQTAHKTVQSLFVFESGAHICACLGANVNVWHEKALLCMALQQEAQCVKLRFFNFYSQVWLIGIIFKWKKNYFIFCAYQWCLTVLWCCFF